MLPKLLLLSFLSSSIYISCTELETELKILTLLPYPNKEIPQILQPSYDNGEVLFPAAEIAVELANNSSNILQGYRLKLLKEDSGCSFASQALYKLASSLAKSLKTTSSVNSGNIVGAIGPACSVSSKAVAEFSGHSEIALLNIVLSASLELNSNRTRYSFGIMDSAEAVSKAILSLIRNWKDVSILYDDSRMYFTSIARLVNSKMKMSSRTLNLFPLSADNLSPKTIQEAGNKSRVIILLLDSVLLSRVICIAEKEKLTSSETYQFILNQNKVMDVSDVEIQFKKEIYNCTKLQIKEAMNDFIIVQHQLQNPEETNAGISLEMFNELYHAKLMRQVPQQPRDPHAPLLFDAMWSLIMSLNNSMSRIDLGSYRYGQSDSTDIIKEELLQLDYEGLSGKIRFNNTTSRVRQNVNIFQRNETGGKVLMGSYDRERDEIVRTSEKLQTIINDRFEFRIFTLPKGLGIFMLVIVGMILALILTLNIITCIYRRQKSVKSSGIKLNLLSFISCYLFIAALITTILTYCFTDKIKSQRICIMQHFLDFSISIGLTLLLGTVCVRTWRVYRIFIHYRNPGRFLTENALTTFVLIITLINTLLKIPDLFYSKYEADEEIKDRNIIIRCRRKYFREIFSIGLLMSAILLIITVILGFYTRKVPNKNFRSNLIMVHSYLFSIIIPITVGLYTIYFLIPGTVGFIVSFCSLCVLLYSLIFIPCLLHFLPPLLPVFKLIKNSPTHTPSALHYPT